MPMRVFLYINKMRGGEKSPSRKPLSKIAWSWLGAFAGIYVISILSTAMELENFFLLASFGASAVLIYGAPQLDFSQPRNFLGGQVISALVGVSVYKYLSYDLAVFKCACCLFVDSGDAFYPYDASARRCYGADRRDRRDAGA